MGRKLAVAAAVAATVVAVLLIIPADRTLPPRTAGVPAPAARETVQDPAVDASSGTAPEPRPRTALGSRRPQPSARLREEERKHWKVRVHGRVLLPTLEGAAGAEVVLRSMSGAGGFTAAQQDGSFELGLREVQAFRPLALLHGFGNAVGAWVDPAGKQEIDLGDLILLRALPMGGKVVDAEGRPVSDVHLYLDTEADPRPEEWALRIHRSEGARSRGDGEFSFEAVPEGLYQITATVPDYDQDRVLTWSNVPAGKTDLKLEVPAQQRLESLHIRVRVQEPDGSPLSYGRLSFQDKRGYDIPGPEIRHGSAETQVSLLLPARLLVDHMVSSSKLGGSYQPAFRRVDPEKRDAYRIRLGDGGTLRGRVRCRGHPVAIGVQARGVLGAGGGGLDELHESAIITFEARCEPDGTFEMSGLPPGIVELQAAPDSGYRTVRPLAVHVGSKNVTLDVLEVAAIEGLVRAGAGVMMGEVDIEIRELGPAGESYGWLRAEGVDVLSRGQVAPFEFAGLFQHWRYRIRATGVTTRGEFLPPVEQVRFAGERKIELVLERGGFTLEGIVAREDGSPVPAAIVRVQPPQDVPPLLLHYDGEETVDFFVAKTDVLGRFRFDGLGDASQTVTVEADGLDLRGGSTRVQAGGRTVRLVLSPARRLSGRVVDPEGLELTDLQLEVWRVRAGTPDAEPAALAGVQYDGFFTAEVAAGRYRLVVWNPYAHLDSRCFVSRPVAVGSGSRDLSLQLQRGRSIVGFVQDAAGKPARGAAVVVEGDWGRRPTWSRSDGSFTVWGLPRGPYTVSAHLGELRSQTLRVRSGAAPVRLTLRPR